MIEILAILSASGAAGMRIALPLLLIGLFSQNLWSNVPLLSKIPAPIVLGVLTSWSLFEIFASKRLLGQRVLQIIQLLLTPIVATMISVSFAKITNTPIWLTLILGIVGGLLALVIQLVQIGWFYRLRGLPLWFVFIEDILCIFLIALAFDAPKHGGLIAMVLLWVAIRSSQEWRRWYKKRQLLGTVTQLPD